VFNRSVGTDISGDGVAKRQHAPDGYRYKSPHRATFGFFANRFLPAGILLAHCIYRPKIELASQHSGSLTMRITCHHSFDDLLAHQARWNELARGVPFRRWEWLESWWRHYGLDAGQPVANQQLWLLAVWDGEQLIAVAPWYLSRTWSDGRVVRALGADEVCSDYVSILCQSGHEDRVGGALAEWLTHNSRPEAKQDSGWDLLELASVMAGDRMISRLLEQLTELGNDFYPRAGLSCWRLDLPPRWDDLVARLSKSHRKQVRRSARKLAGDQAVMRRATTSEELEQGFQILIDLHQRRWQSRGEEGCFARPRFLAFHREVSARLFAAGCVELAWVDLDRRPLVAEYNLLSSDVMYAYQSGMDPERLEHEPGRLGITAMLQLAMRRGLRGYDFLRGDEPYKAHWRAQPRPTWDIRVVPRRAGARLRQGVLAATDNLKTWIKSGLEFAGLR
jgi:CelD/BcsL family acetyltransferase involved in cellulose biosynthesis